MSVSKVPTDAGGQSPIADLATTMQTLYYLFVTRVLWDSTDTCCLEVVITWLNASQTAKSFIVGLQYKNKT